jgi:lipopolysaccharide transport system ATP-binding protein
MSDTVISVENISKIYRLGEVGTGSLAHDVNRWWHRIRGKEDPYLKVGQVNDRTESVSKAKTAKGVTNDWVYALKDASFSVKQGEVLGIIGRNGAGKSTLLKILSRVTTQSSGRINIRGRIASLLEVGTGFHPELTGRENIYLNGAILGMRKSEILRKFNEIIDFSGCARYIDTPVKRYSSGMYVRLAFAVAAHLDPEILIVDEVLAVGDAEFQRKCLGKMRDVALGGRTVLFVSHNTQALAAVCTSAILLEHGSIVMKNCSVDAAIAAHLKNGTSNQYEIPWRWSGEAGDESITLHQFYASAVDEKDGFRSSNDIQVVFETTINKSVSDLVVGFHIYNSQEQQIAFTAAYDSGGTDDTKCRFQPGRYIFKSVIPKDTLGAGSYRLIPNIGIHNRKRIIGDSHSIMLEIQNVSGIGRLFTTGSGIEGIFRPSWPWQVDCQTA